MWYMNNFLKALCVASVNFQIELQRAVIMSGEACAVHVQIEAVETVLEPGDTLFFPPRWAHYTESLDLSISLTYRFGPRRPATARLVNGLRQCKVSAKNMAGIRCGRIFVK